MARHVVAAAADFPPGTRRLITINDRDVVVFNVKGEYFGLYNKCPHNGGSLAQGVLTGLVQSTAPGDYSYTRQGEIIRCPWHGWEFDIRTGQSWCDPVHTKVKAYHVKVETGEEVEKLGDKSKGPYIAETFQVSVKDNYILVDV